jgi:hypothetical protein
MPRHPAPRTPPAPSRPWRAPAPRRCRRSGGRGAAAGEMSWAAVRRTTWRPRRATASCRPFGGGGPPPPPPGGGGGRSSSRHCLTMRSSCSAWTCPRSSPGCSSPSAPRGSSASPSSTGTSRSCWPSTSREGSSGYGWPGSSSAATPSGPLC